jgi:hypothetical protein
MDDDKSRKGTRDNAEKTVIDHVADKLTTPDPKPKDEMQPPLTPHGKPVEEQVRKEWDPKRKGGLPIFLRARPAPGKPVRTASATVALRGKGDRHV